MKISHINSKVKWETLLNQWPEANFLQSWNWGIFHKSLGKDVYYLSIDNKAKNVLCALVISEKAKRGNYLTIAGGPLMDWDEKNFKKSITLLLTELNEIAKKEQAVFVRIRPQEIQTQKLMRAVEEIGFKKSPMHLTADLTLQLDLSKKEEDLLSKMRKNTRYDIRKADKLGIKIKLSKNPDEIKEFYEYQLELADRQSFVPFSFEFLKKQFVSFLADDQVLLVHSYLDNKLLASAFVIFYRNEAVYHYGISTEDNFRLPGSYACQWAAIKEAKKRGIKYYNFWGVAPKDKLNHRFAGVGIFKRGFGGEEIQYLPAYDYAFSKIYFFVKEFEFLRKKLRGL